MTNYLIQEDSSRWIEIVGDLLASSSSKDSHKPRWVEFNLYRTHTGTYVLSRVGKSLLFHQKSCKIVGRNKLKPVTQEDISPEAVPCPDCHPSRSPSDELYPETPRYFAQKTTTAKGVLVALTQQDDNNSEYLTNVAKRLLMDAAKVDDEIGRVFYMRTIE